MYAARKRHRNFKRNRPSAENEAPPTGSNPSKRHRERLNSELEALALLLPFENSIIGRLDKLSILRLAVCFLQAKNVFQHITKEHLECLYYPEFPFLHNKLFEDKDTLITALSGFLIMLNMNGDMLYVSENVSSYLGFHQCDVLYQSVFDVVHTEDIERIRQMLRPVVNCPRQMEEQGWLTSRHTAVRFRCFMDNTCGFLRFDVRGKLIKLDNCHSPFPQMCQMTGATPGGRGSAPAFSVPYGFLAACVPVVVPSHVDISIEESFLKSKHSLQFTVCSADEGFLALLGLKESSLPISFYSFIHENDLPFIADAHRQVLASGNSGVLIYRLRSGSKNLIYWLQSSCRLTARNGKPEFIVCTHRLLTEFEGTMLLEMRDSTEMTCRNNLENQTYYDNSTPVGGGVDSLMGPFPIGVQPSSSALITVASTTRNPWKMSNLHNQSYIGADQKSIVLQQPPDYVNDLIGQSNLPIAQTYNGYGCVVDGASVKYKSVLTSQYASETAENAWYAQSNFTNLQQTLLMSERHPQYNESGSKEAVAYFKSNCFVPSTPTIGDATIQSAQSAGTKIFSISQVTNTLLCQ